MKYKTKNKTALIKYLKCNSDKHLTIQEIQRGLPEIPQATLYRLIDTLVNEGTVRKYIIGSTLASCYQFAECEDEHEHFHLVCEKCGRLFHLKCHEVDHLLKHINKEHGFSIDTTKVNLYGICEDCKKGQIQ